MTLWTSFNKTADRPWFVFDEAGKTVRAGFATRRSAEAWAYQRMFPPPGTRNG